MALLAEHDPASARVESERAVALAREVGVVDVEMFALALNGLSLVSLGETEAGMRLIDAAAAAAVGGEMTDADSIESVCCFALDACKRVRDLERANEWCLRVRDIAKRFGDRHMFAICRTHYADVLLWYGDWARADQELTAAAQELGAIGPGRSVDALARLAELRRRQGRTPEAGGAACPRDAASLARARRGTDCARPRCCRGRIGCGRTVPAADRRERPLRAGRGA